MPVAELKLVAQKPKYEFLEMRKKRGICEGAVALQKLKIYMKTQHLNYYNIPKFQEIPRLSPT